MRIFFAISGVLIGLGGVIGFLAAATMPGQISALIALVIAALLVIGSALLETIERQCSLLVAAINSSKSAGKP